MENTYKYADFNEWFNEREFITFRSERFYVDLNMFPPSRIVQWLEAAFTAGRENSVDK
jgi:hypothetical protein